VKSKRGRIDRYLAKTLQVSLKDIRLKIVTGKVMVDHVAVSDAGLLIDEFSVVECDGILLQNNTPLYIVLNKPIGYVSATKDDEHATVMDLIDHPLKHTLHIVGRLDLNSTGLVLLTNDSRWSSRINHANETVDKCYHVSVKNPLNDEYIEAFKRGIYFEYEDKTTKPAKLTLLSSNDAHVVLTEGMYHQIKRMFGRFRNEVLALHRISVGQLKLDDSIPGGAWKELTKESAHSIFDDTHSPDN
jgi:16S rRNA pseudouridine516 synthase